MLRRTSLLHPTSGSSLRLRSYSMQQLAGRAGVCTTALARRQAAAPLLSCADVVARHQRHLCSSPQSKPQPTSVAPVATVTKTSSAAGDAAMKGEVVDAVRRAWTFLWDPAEPALRWRIGAAFVLMIGAKLTTIQVPFLFKFAVDALSDSAATAAAGDATAASMGLLALTPASLLLALFETQAAQVAFDVQHRLLLRQLWRPPPPQ